MPPEESRDDTPQGESTTGSVLDVTPASDDTPHERTVRIRVQRGVDLPAKSSEEFFRFYFVMVHRGAKGSDAVTRALPQSAIVAWNESILLTSLGYKDERLFVVLIDQSRQEGVDSLDIPSADLSHGDFVWCLKNGARLLGACESVDANGDGAIDVNPDSSVIPMRPQPSTHSAGELAMHWAVALDGLTEAAPGRKSSFRVVVRDGSEAFRQTGLTFDVMVYDGLDFNRGTVTDNNDGSYRVHFCVLRPAPSYAVSVLLRDKDIVGSPVLLQGPVLPPSALVSRAFGDGLQTALCGHVSIFTLHLFDAKGQHVDQHNQVTITIDAPAALGGPLNGPSVADIACVPAVRRVSLGVFEVRYKAPASQLGCQLQVSVLVTGAHVAASPFSVTVREAPTSPEHCTVAGDGLFTARPGVDSTFSISTADARGTRRLTGGDEFSVKLAGSTRVLHAVVHDNGDGTYDVSYHVAEPDNYTISVSLFQSLIFEGMLRIEPGLPSPANSAVQFNGSSAGFVGCPVTFSVLARDKWGTDVPGVELDVRICSVATNAAVQTEERFELRKLIRKCREVRVVFEFGPLDMQSDTQSSRSATLVLETTGELYTGAGWAPFHTG
jgi:hypothetical protein